MPRSLARVDIRRGVVAIINGLALWFLAVLAYAYAEDDVLPWRSLEGFFATAVTFTRDRLSTPGSDPLELLIYVSVALVILGPLWFWGVFPSLKPRILPYIRRIPTITSSSRSPDRSTEAAYFWPNIWGTEASSSRPTDSTSSILGWSPAPDHNNTWSPWGQNPSGQTGPSDRHVIEFRRPQLPTGARSVKLALQRVTHSIRQPTSDQRMRIRMAVIVIAVGMVMAASGVYLVLGGEIAGSQPSLGGAPADAALFNQSSAAISVHERINAHRNQTGLAPLAWNRRLANLSADHSEDMRTNDYLGHVSSDGLTLSDRLARSGYSCHAATELVLSTYYREPVRGPNGTVVYRTEDDLSEGIVRTMIESSRHRPVLLNGSWSETGVGLAVDDDGQVYATVTFCS